MTAPDRPLAVVPLGEGEELRLTWRPGRGLELSVWTKEANGVRSLARTVDVPSERLPELSEGVCRAACRWHWEAVKVPSDASAPSR